MIGCILTNEKCPRCNSLLYIELDGGEYHCATIFCSFDGEFPENNDESRISVYEEDTNIYEESDVWE
jgi:hypothetical protein